MIPGMCNLPFNIIQGNIFKFRLLLKSFINHFVYLVTKKHLELLTFSVPVKLSSRWIAWTLLLGNVLGSIFHGNLDQD